MKQLTKNERDLLASLILEKFHSLPIPTLIGWDEYKTLYDLALKSGLEELAEEINQDLHTETNVYITQLN